MSVAYGGIYSLQKERLSAGEESSGETAMTRIDSAKLATASCFFLLSVLAAAAFSGPLFAAEGIPQQETNVAGVVAELVE